MDAKSILEKYVCPGCVCGSNTDCGEYKPSTAYGLSCDSHVCGTTMDFRHTLALGMPRGFNMCARVPGESKSSSKLPIRIWAGGDAPMWNKLNMPLWAQEIDGMLFVRTVSPRIGVVYVDIIEITEGTSRVELVPGALDVALFVDEIS
jgi:hypothetical protein